MANRKIIAAGLLVGLWSQSAFAQEQKSEDLYKKSLPSIMTLMVDKKDGSKVLGTAFLAIKDGLAVTAWHVVRDATKVQAKFSNGEIFESSGLVDKDEKRDIAVIRVKVFGRPALELKGVDVEVGSKAFVIGAPEGLEFSITDGIVSQIQSIDGIRYYQYSCPTSHGNSGGPVLTANGAVLGVVSWGLTKGQNLNFAVPSTYVLGLDSSLATTEWASVKTTEPAKGNDTKEASPTIKVNNQEFDKEMVSAIEVVYNGQISVDFTYDRVVTRRGGFQNGVPSDLYARQNKLNVYKELLDSFRANDATRESARKALQAKVTILAYGIRQLMEGIKTCQSDDGWTDRAKDSLNRSQATIRGLTDSHLSDPMIAYLALAEVREACPARLLIPFGYARDDSGFKLGVLSFTDTDDKYLAVIDKDGLAFRMGLRSDDILKDLDGKPVVSLMDFKAKLKAYVGKKVKMTVIRDRKDKTFDMKVPEDLNKF